ncbi:hypothetical protein [Nocardioides sp. KR10-350]|uniref:hypothetical protein n=1 Tax=Nocardioides cheoyonin TaxID=3156615 RepID=UPI0032B61743
MYRREVFAALDALTGRIDTGERIVIVTTWRAGVWIARVWDLNDGVDVFLSAESDGDRCRVLVDVVDPTIEPRTVRDHLDYLRQAADDLGVGEDPTRSA